MNWIRHLLATSDQQEHAAVTQHLDTLHNDGETWHWTCPCGSHSRGNFPIESDAQLNADRHQLNQPPGHPQPKITQK